MIYYVKINFHQYYSNKNNKNLHYFHRFTLYLLFAYFLNFLSTIYACFNLRIMASHFFFFFFYFDLKMNFINFSIFNLIFFLIFQYFIIKFIIALLLKLYTTKNQVHHNSFYINDLFLMLIYQIKSFIYSINVYSKEFYYLNKDKNYFHFYFIYLAYNSSWLLEIYCNILYFSSFQLIF